MGKINYQIKQLNNGLSVRGVQNTALHSVTMGFFLPINPTIPQKNERGIYHFLEHMFFRKMHGFSQEELYYKTESIGASLKASTYKDYICFYMTVRPKYCYEAFDILFRLFLPPSWNAEDISAEKKVVVNQILYQDYYDFLKISDKVYYKNTGYEYPTMGFKSNARYWTNEKVNQYRQLVFNPAQSTFVITGNYQNAWFEDFCSMMNSLKIPKERIDLQTEKPQRFAQRNENDCFFYKTNYDAADILLSFDVPQFSDICQMQYISSILGEGYGSMLSAKLRERSGITNEIYSYLYQVRSCTRFIIQCMSSNENIEKCLQEIFSILTEFCTEIPQRNFEMAKIFLTQNRMFLYDNSEHLMEFLGNSFIYSDLFCTIEELIERYEAISLRQLRESANILFSKKNLFLAISHNGKVNDSTIYKNYVQWR